MFFFRSSPRIIPFYLGKDFLRVFLSCLFFLWGIALLIDFFDRLDDFIRQGAHPISVLRYFFFKSPLFVSQMAPAAALTGSLLSLSLFSRNRELLAFKSCGVGTFQIAWPLLIVSGILSASIWGWDEFVVPPSFHKARIINSEEIKKKPFNRLFDDRGFWYHGENSFYHIEHFDSRANVLSGIIVYRIRDEFQIFSVVEISQARWEENHWECQGIKERAVSTSSSPLSLTCDFLLRETPEDFSVVALEAEEFSSRQLRQYIADLTNKGLDTTMYRVDLHLKSALPVTVLTMVLLGISLSVPGARQMPPSTSLGIALVIGFGYWVLLAFSVSLGHSGAIPPIISAWLANIATCLAGIFFLLGVD
ncbi:MAG: LPS export ABC transporter permease LptG [Candidatus Binatia bacterium]